MVRGEGPCSCHGQASQSNDGQPCGCYQVTHCLAMPLNAPFRCFLASPSCSLQPAFAQRSLATAAQTVLTEEFPGVPATSQAAAPSVIKVSTLSNGLRIASISGSSPVSAATPFDVRVLQRAFSGAL